MWVISLVSGDAPVVGVEPGIRETLKVTTSDIMVPLCDVAHVRILLPPTLTYGMEALPFGCGVLLAVLKETGHQRPSKPDS